MNQYLKDGWKAALRQPFAVLTLFIYQLLWGVAIYKFVQSIVVPLMHRYPGAGQTKGASQIFLAEGQFQLLKTDISHSYLWWMVALLAARMLLTPLINAAVYYSLGHTELKSGYRFFKGMKELGLPFFIAYLVQMALTLSPLFWLLPKAMATLSSSSSYETALVGMLPWFIGFLIYGYLLRLCFMFIQFAIVHQTSLISSVGVLLRYFLRVAYLAIILVLLSGLLTATVVTTSYIWAGLLALLIYQLYPLFVMFFQVWTIAAQYQLWTAKTNT
jgi:hypothetical protein